MVMVMETPSPQIVGLQFVREYYTMLNQAPEHLHRFYNSNSSFVHGSLDLAEKTSGPAYGQQEIHKRIMQLSFRDCHARILIVDSLGTLGNGVVVQVSGELSNNRRPMRRFMQTFVLALQSPKKYYVHNDILRYQDEVFPDDQESEIPDNVENECEVESTVTNETPTSQDVLAHFYPRPLQNGSTLSHETSSQVPTAPAESVQEPVLTNLVSPPQPQIPATPVAVESANSTSTSVHSQVETPPSQPEVEPDVSSDAEKPEYVSQDEEDYREKSLSKSPEPAVERISEPAADGPKTYATMLTKNPGGGSFASSPPNVASVVTNNVAGQKSFHNASSPIRPEVKADNFSQQQPRASRPNNKTSAGVQRVADDSAENERRRPLGHYPDNQQLFVGNLPYDVDETALRNVFADYGTVVDMRINTKPPSMMKGGNLGGRNFGFIVFHDPDTVTTILSAKQTHYLGDLRLNVEEKKARVRMGNNDMRPSMGGRGGGNMGRIGGPMMGHRGGGNRGSGGGGNMGGGGMRGDGRGGGSGGRGGYMNRR